MDHLNLDNLIDLALERSNGSVEIEVAGQVLTVCSAEMLPQRNRLLLAQAQAELQDYYSAVIQEQQAIEEKLKDQALSATQRTAIQAESKEVAVKIAMRMFSASEALMTSNIVYIEAMTQLESGKLMEMIETAIDGRVSGDRKASIIAMLIAQTSQLIRTAMDDQEKKYQEAIAARVRSLPRAAIVVPMTPEQNGKKQKSPSGVAS